MDYRYQALIREYMDDIARSIVCVPGDVKP